MKPLLLKLILPLTIISFAGFTKWWYALPVDAPDTMLSGFPLPFICPGWHTSMSLQIFVMEFIIDILTYFVFWFVIVFCIDRFAVKIHPPKRLTIVLWVCAGIMICGASFIAAISDKLFYVKRPFDMEVMETGYHFIWQDTERPDYYKYHPEARRD